LPFAKNSDFEKEAKALSAKSNQAELAFDITRVPNPELVCVVKVLALEEVHIPHVLD